MPTPVDLDMAEIETVAVGAVLRILRNMRDAKRNRYGFDGDNWRIGVNSFGAEIAIGKLLAAYPTGMGLTGDVGGVEVRWTAYPNGALILHPADPDRAPFVLVTGELPHYSAVGWINAADGKRPEYWRDDRRWPAWFVPQAALHPIDRVAVAALSLAALPPAPSSPPGGAR